MEAVEFVNTVEEEHNAKTVEAVEFVNTVEKNHCATTVEAAAFVNMVESNRSVSTAKHPRIATPQYCKKPLQKTRQTQG